MTAVPRRLARWLDERWSRVVYSVGLRLRLLRLVLRRQDRIPTLVMLALESPDSDAAALFDPDMQPAIDQPPV